MRIKGGTYGIPEWFKDDDARGGCQVQAQGSALQRAEQDAARLLLAQHFQARLAEIVPHTTIIAGVFIPISLQKRLNQVQHTRELAEDDEFMLISFLGEDAKQMRDLGGCDDGR